MFSRNFVISNDYLYELFIFLEFKSLNPFLAQRKISGDKLFLLLLHHGTV